MAANLFDMISLTPSSFKISYCVHLTSQKKEKEKMIKLYVRN